jgi:hypothetical protein
VALNTIKQTNKQTQTYTVLDMEYKIKKECAVDIFKAKYFVCLFHGV